MDQEIKDTSVLTKGTEDHSSSVDIFEDEEEEEESHNVMNDESAPVASSQETKDENITQDEVELTESIETPEVDDEDEDDILGLVKPSEENVSLEDDVDDVILLEDTQDSPISLSGQERVGNIQRKESELLKNKNANGDIITTFSKSITFPKSGEDEKKSNSGSLMTVGSTSKDNSNDKEHDMSDAGTDFDQEESLVIDESSNDREDSTDVPIDVDDVSEETKSSQFTSVASTSISKVLSSSPSSNNWTVTPNRFAQKDSTPLHIKLLKKRKQKAISSEVSPEAIESFRIPFKHGWKREVVNRNVVSSGKGSQCDIYYFTPQGKKLRSMVEIETWLSEHEAGPVRIKNFSFARTQLFEPPHEIVRDAGKSRRNPNSDTPKPKPTLTKKVEKTTKETGFKRVLVTPLGANKNQNPLLSATSVVAEGSNSIARSSPKIKFVPMVNKPGIISSLQKKLAKHGKKPGHTFLNKSSQGSPDWEPSDSDSEERNQHSSIVRNVEIIKYSASDEPSSGLGGRCDELQNVLGTPSKLISSIVNPKPPPPPPAPVAPVPITLDSGGLPATGVRFQILAKRNAKPEEIISQLGWNKTNMKYRVIKPNEAVSHSTVPTKDFRMVVPSQVHPNMRSLLGQRMPQLQQRPNSSLLQLAISSPTGVQPLKVLPPPPPLALRPRLPTPPIIRTPPGKVILPTLLPGGSTANPTTTAIYVHPPPFQTAMMRPTNPPPPPRLQVTNMPPPRLTAPMSLATKSSHLSTLPPPLSLSVSKTVPPPSTSSGQNSSLPASKTIRSSTDDLVDKIYNDLPHFLGLGTGHHNISTGYSSIPSLQVPSLLSKTDFGSPHYSQAAVRAHGPLVGKRNESLLEALNPLNSNFLMDEHFQKRTGAVVGGNDDLEDTDNIDSSLPISFDSMDKDGSSCPTPVDEMEDTSDKGFGDSTDDNSTPTLSCKSYLLFKLLQDNYPVMLKLFEHLPMYDLLRASQVCKQWHRISMMSDLWQHVEIDSVFHDNWDKAVKFFIKVGVKSLKITKHPDASKPHSTDAMVKALNKMTQLKVLQFDVIHQHTVAHILETMPHLENVGTEHIIETEPLTNRRFVWSSFPKELAMARAVDAVVTEGKPAVVAATMYGVPEAELKHLMLSDKSSLLKQEEDAVLLCSMRLSSMGFPINENFLETRLQEEISKRPQPCQQSSQMTKRICERLLRENQHLFKQKLPYRLSDPVFKKLISYSSSLHRLYKTIGVEKANSVFAFYMKKISVLNFVGNRLCQVTALSVFSAANISLPIMLIFSNGIRRHEGVSNLILVNSKDGLVTPNLISHYLRACFSHIDTRPLVLFFKGDENVISHQLVSDCINGSVFLHCIPQDISEFVFPGYHGGVLNSVSEIMNDNLMKENDFITLIREEMDKGSNNTANVFAKTGLFPVKRKPDNTESEEDSLPEEGSVCNGESSTQEEGIDKENLETNKGDDPFQQQSGYVQISTSPPHSVISNYGSALTQNSDVPNGGDKGTSLNRPFPGAGRRQKLTPRKKRSPFVSSLLNTVKTNVSSDTDTSDMNGKKSSLKRTFTVVHEMDVTATDPVKKSKFSKDQPDSSMSSVEESINQVIAKSLEETDAKEKEEKASDEINDDGKDSDISESTNIPMRPSLKIRRSAQGLISVLNSDYPSKQISEENDASDDEEEDDKEEDSEVEEEEEKGGSSYEEMEVVDDEDDDNEECDNDNSSDEADESKASVDQHEKEELDGVSSDMSDEDQEEGTPAAVEGQGEAAIDTSCIMEDDSDNESPEKRVKKLKKNKKKRKKEHSHSFSKDNGEQSENENDKKYPRVLHKKKRKEKRRKKAKRRDEEKLETFSVLEISSLKTEPVTVTANLLDKEEDEKEKKLIHIRRTSKVDHDYDTKFDSDSGTEVVTEDSILKIQVESEEANTVAEIDDCNESTVASSVSMPLDDKTAEEKDKTSDSSSSSSSCSSSDDSDNENGSNEKGSGSGSTENSGNSSSRSDSDQEDVEEDNPTPEDNATPVVKVKEERVPGEVIGKVGGNEEPTDLNENKSSSGDEDISASSESDKDENEEEDLSDEEEEDERDDDGNDDEDSNCQLCMLSNPPHTKDTIIDWVDCDGNCGRWFHVICINRSQARANPKHYICPSCRCKR